jgi:stage VI sporulation protein D
MVINADRDMKGGVALSQENQSFLRFSLEESVWFQKGQEVAELVSISLDPNITIIENDQYVAIRGSLELTGEYKRIDEVNLEQEEPISTPKFVQSVEEREEGLCEFLHRFPVDITIPNNRIQSVYDIDVTVDSFDYVVPERSCLKLVADLTISGLYGEQQNVPIDEEEQVEQEFEFELGREDEETPTEISLGENRETEPQAEAVQAEENEELEPMYRVHQEEEQAENQTYSPNFILSYPNESPIDELEDESDLFDYSKPFTAEAKRDPEEDENENQGFSWGVPSQTAPKAIPKLPDFSLNAKRAEAAPPKHDSSYEPSDEMGIQVEAAIVVETESPEVEVESSSSSSPEKGGLLKKLTKKKSMSIAEFLGRKTDHEQHAKLKVCIVQHGDTLDTLSERYALPVQQIKKVNHLEANQDVYEGQVLYIPETASSK